MKRVILAIVIALFGITASGVAPIEASTIYAQKKGGDKGDKEKKDRPGPPVVRDKEPKPREEKPKPKEKKPGN
jgi:hypothetical protein